MDSTYVEDLKDSVEVPVPPRNRIFVRLRMEAPRKWVSFTPLGNILLDLGHSAAIHEWVA